MVRLSHKDRRRRRRRIAEAVRAGRNRAELAAEFGVTLANISTACREFGVVIGEILKKRRRQIAKAVKSGKYREDVAAEFGVSLAYVHHACKEFKVRGQRGRRKGHALEGLRARWAGVDWGLNDAAIARGQGLSRERIRQIRMILGMPKAPRRRLASSAEPC